MYHTISKLYSPKQLALNCITTIMYVMYGCSIHLLLPGLHLQKIVYVLRFCVLDFPVKTNEMFLAVVSSFTQMLNNYGS